MTKKFSNGFDHKTVVNNVTLDFYENQITGFLGIIDFLLYYIIYFKSRLVNMRVYFYSILGHNGAGKTTVTFILCGKPLENS